MVCPIIELRLTPRGVGALLACPPAVQPAPGQYLLAHVPGQPELLPTPLFRAGLDASGQPSFFAAPPLPPFWVAGMEVQARGPLGQGFHLPASARSIALVALDGGLDRLLPLAQAGLEQGSAVVIYSEDPVENLPSSVEVFPLDLLPEVLTWADYAALNLPIARVSEWPVLFGLAPEARLPFAAEALVSAPMPCGGRAACGVCSLRTRSGWQLICRDGPVFPLLDLI